MERKVLCFEGFTLDMERGCLLAGATEIALRPKTFALLHYLAANPRRLIPKQELIDAIWHGGAVTDDAIVQAVGELRRALGDAGTRIIRTTPRRGYRFESAVTFEAQVAAMPAAAPAIVPESVASPAAPAWSPRGRFFYYSAALVVLVVAGLAWLTVVALRYDIGFAGSSTGVVATAAKPAVAVLPFSYPEGDSSRLYFADGLTQDLISALGRFSSLTVMSWNAVLPYRASPAEPQRVARAFDVRYQIEGTVQQTNGRVRVLARLVDTRGRVLWSERFDEAREDLFVLQEELTAQIARALGVRITAFEQQRVLAKRPSNLEAYDHVLRARPALRSPTRENIAEARVMLRRATELDAEYAAAWSALAETYYIAVVQGWTESPAQMLERAEECASRALAIDPSDVRGHVELGRVYLFHGRYEEAKLAMERAIAINPNDADGLAGRGHVLMWRGDTDAAIEALEAAQGIDPDLSFSERFALALAYYLDGRYQTAIEQAEHNLRRGDVSAGNHIVLAVSLAQLGRIDEALERARLTRAVDPAFDLGAFGSKLQNPADAQHLREGLRRASLYEGSN